MIMSLTTAPVSASQIQTVLSRDLDATCLPSGEKATDVTPLEGIREHGTGPASQIRIDLSFDPDATRMPSGEKPTDVTEPVCPSNGSERMG